MIEQTFKALDGLRRAVAKSQGIDESQFIMTVNCRSEEIPAYFYDIEEIECECGHQRDDHFNAGERNFCAGGNSINDELACQCDNFEANYE